MAEWFNAPVLKTGGLLQARGFESLPVRKEKTVDILVVFVAVSAAIMLGGLGWLVFTPMPPLPQTDPVPDNAILLITPKGTTYGAVWRNDANTRTCLRFSGCPRTTIVWDPRLDAILCAALQNLPEVTLPEQE